MIIWHNRTNYLIAVLSNNKLLTNKFNNEPHTQYTTHGHHHVHIVTVYIHVLQ